MSGRLSGKVAIVTGASAGIGRASALALAAEGAQLVLVARRQKRLEELAAAIDALGTKTLVVMGDVREEKTAKKAVKLALEEAGRIDILLNNAGIGIYKRIKLIICAIKKRSGCSCSFAFGGP